MVELPQPRSLDEILFNELAGLRERRQWLDALVLHFFNHQTHHRGQATTLLMQAGQDVGVTDLLAMPFADPADDSAPVDPPRAVVARREDEGPGPAFA